MLAEAHRALDQADDEVRVLVLTGAPPAFCAGADLSFFRARLDEPAGCDLIVADQNATFTDAHSRLGIAPAVGAAAGLVRAVGEIRAKQIRLLSEPVDAAAMAGYGLVTAVTAPGDLERRTTELAATLSERSPVSVAAMKAMVHRARQPSWEQTLESDLAFFRQNWGSAAMRAGLDAYAAGRTPGAEPPAGPNPTSGSAGRHQLLDKI